jgi:hypothetical protein
MPARAYACVEMIMRLLCAVADGAARDRELI